MSSVQIENSTELKKCFVIMPIADISDYGAGHFKRVYEHLIKPACLKAGFDVTRADETKNSNLIILDILQQIYSADIVICDLSAKNPNVMYELGIRQAFELPTMLIKDKITTRVFDISGLRDVEYEHTLRIDDVENSIDEIADALKSTYAAYESGEKKHINSIVSLLGISPAKVRETEISQDTALILDSIQQINSRITSLESRRDFNDSYFKGSITEREGRPTYLDILNKEDPVRTESGRSGRILDFVGISDVAVGFKDGSIEIHERNKLKKISKLGRHQLAWEFKGTNNP